MRYVACLLAALVVAGLAVNGRRGLEPRAESSPWLLNDVCVISDWLSWGVGDDGVIARSLGDGWVLDTVLIRHLGSLAQSDFTGVFFWDERHGWIVGNENKGRAESGRSGAVVLRTIDGGDNWEARFPFVPKLSSLLRVKFGTPYCGCILAENGYMLLTNDGGITWVPTYAGDKADSIYQTWSTRVER